MAFAYNTRRNKTYYLHSGPKRGGGIQHFFSTSPDGPLADAIPEGFEVYETPNGQVYLRRQKPQLLSDEEIACVRKELAKDRASHLYQLEVSGDMLVIHEGESKANLFRKWNPFISERGIADIARQTASFQPVMRFVLDDPARRLFRPERFCFRGSVDDWIAIGPPAPLGVLVRKFCPHLGKESIYELY